MNPTNQWSDKNSWVQVKVATGNVNAYFNQPTATPSLTGDIGISLLTVRSGGNNDKPGAAPYTTELQLKGNDMKVSQGINVLSAAGNRAGNVPAPLGKGRSPDANFTLTSSQGGPTVTSGEITVGVQGSTVMNAGKPDATQNVASLIIDTLVKVNVTGGGGRQDVIVGGNTVGSLDLEGALTARNLSIGGVSSPGAVVTGATLDGKVDLSGSFTVGAQNNATVKAKGANVKAYIQSGDVTVGKTVQIGDYNSADLDIGSQGSLDAKGAMNVGNPDPKNTSGPGTLDVSGSLTVGGTFTNTANGDTTLKTGSTIDFKLKPVNQKGANLTVQKGVKFKTRGFGGLLNQGNIQFGATAGATNGDIAMQGDFTQQAGGQLLLTLAGNQVGQSYDRLLVTPLGDEPGGGNVTLGGSLDVSSSYTPTPWLIGGPAGDYFTVVSAATSLTGTFDPLTGMNLPDPSQYASSLPALPSGYGYQWRVIYDTTDSADPNLAASDPAITSQPWAGNGTRDVVLVLEEAPLKPNLAITSAGAVGTSTVSVGYTVENLPVTQPFSVSLFTSQDGHTLDTPNAPFASATVPAAAVGAQTAVITFPGQALPAGEQLIAVVDSGNAIAESSEYDNALVLGQLQASDQSDTVSDPVFPYTLTLAAPSSVPVTVNYQTADGTAVAGTDYTAVSGSVTFAPGQTQQEIDVPLLGASGSPGKTFLLHFSSPTDGYFVDASGQVIAQADAHLSITAPAPSGVVSGYAWQDDNTNGLWDSSESGLANVLVNLTEPDGTVLSAPTDATGYYEFDNLPTGTYGLSSTAVAGTLMEGYYLDDGTAVPSASVTLTGTQPTAHLDAAFIAGASTAASLTSSNSTVYAGQPVTFTANVSATSGSGTPTGTVNFYDGSTLLGSATLTAGTGSALASFTTSSLSLGSHSVTAAYAGDTTYAGSTSPAVTETVSNPAPSISLTSNSANPTLGQSVSFTATVTPSGSGPPPTGSVTFYDGSTALGTVALSPYSGNGGQAVFTTSSLSAGTHSITAVYAGDTNYSGVTSSAVTETVQQAGDMVMESSSNSSVAYGTAVTFTATVYPNVQGLAPTGTISFYDGNTLLATVTLALVNGSYQAAYSISTLSVGSHTIRAVYSGDVNYVSNSASLSESIY